MIAPQDLQTSSGLTFSSTDFVGGRISKVLSLWTESDLKLSFGNMCFVVLVQTAGEVAFRLDSASAATSDALFSLVGSTQREQTSCHNRRCPPHRCPCHNLCRCIGASTAWSVRSPGRDQGSELCDQVCNLYLELRTAKLEHNVAG